MTVAARPAPGVPRPYRFPDVAHLALGNGMRVLVATVPRLPLVSVLALVDAGATHDEAGAEGLASLAARSLTEGTGTMDGAALTERLESLGTGIDSAADWDTAIARLTVMPHRLDEAFALLAGIVRAPAFPAHDVGRKRDERVAALRQRLTEPRGLADQRFSGVLYARESRYARPVGGTIGTAGRLDADAVRSYHRRRYAPATTTLIFVGDVTAERARALADGSFGDWAATPGAGAVVDARAASAERRIVIIDKPDAPQSELRVGHVGVPRAHPDHLRIVVMNALLGGLFSSRINLNLRERHAYTYGASSGFDWRRGAGPFVVSTAVKSEVTDRAVAEIMTEIEGMRTAAPDGPELALATDYLAGVFPLRYESTDAVAGALANAVIHALDDDWFAAYRDRVRAITPDDVLAAARAHVDPSRMLVLALGDAKTIRAPLEALGLGPVTVLEAADDPAEVT
jgi:zinc protease